MTRPIPSDTYTETFIVRRLNDGWEWRDFMMGGSEYDYCIDELEIPEEHLLQAVADVHRQELEISLYGLPTHTSDDWLVNLARISDNASHT